MNDAMQNTDQWLKDRLGKWNASAIGDLMGKGRKKDELFSQTALSYIYDVASQRDLIQAYKDDDTLWEIYQQQVSVNNKHMQWGHENEPLAIEEYERMTGRICVETGRLDHPTIPHFSASPDRLSQEGIYPIVVEVKSPLPKTYMKYKAEIHDNASLLAVEPKYFYQVQAQLMATGYAEADFICFCPFLKHPLHIVRIIADREVQEEIEYRIREAEKIIDNILKQKQ